MRYPWDERPGACESRLDKNAFMRACREGGAALDAALRSLDRAFFSVLYRDCVRVLRDADSARDLVQDTFIKVWQRCATFRAQSELLPWIKAIQRHALLDWLRRVRPSTPLESEGADEHLDSRLYELSVDGVPTPDDQERRRELAACFDRCWRRFEDAAPEHATVIAWIARDGLNHDEIAQLLGRSPGATREYISQCRKRARHHLAEWYAMAFGRG